METLSSKLPNLEVLDLSENYLSNDILPSLEGFTSLKQLDLSNTELDSDRHMEGVGCNFSVSLVKMSSEFLVLNDIFLSALCSTLTNLEVLHLSFNNFNHTDIASALSGLSSLKSLNLAYSKLSWRSILSILSTSQIFILCFLLETISNSL